MWAAQSCLRSFPSSNEDTIRANDGHCCGQDCERALQWCLDNMYRKGMSTLRTRTASKKRASPTSPSQGRCAVGCALMCLPHAGDTIHLLHVVPHAKSSYSGLFSHPDQHQQDLMVRRAVT